MRILLAPLNWGLGHATRCIPIIDQLLQDQNEVIIAADGNPLKLLQQEFPNLEFVDFPSFSIRYSKGKSQILTMLKSLPNIVYGIFSEHYQLKKLIQHYKIHQVISDNRFGLWNNKIKSTYITHQVMIKMPKGLKFLEPAVWLLHRFFIHRYDECWIPDFEGLKNLSGDLSHKYPLPKNAEFIGPLSRFSTKINIEQAILEDEFDVVAIISGPEPQRTVFEEQIIHQYKDSKEKCLIARGLPGSLIQKENISDQLIMFSHLETSALAFYILKAKKIICRSGYSTIMDLYVLNCLEKAEFHPTPGQTEQEYLMQYHNRNTLNV